MATRVMLIILMNLVRAGMVACPEVARILRLSRATLCERICTGLIRTQKDGGRSYITTEELQRYVAQSP